jgi:hypothetical protein
MRINEKSGTILEEQRMKKEKRKSTANVLENLSAILVRFVGEITVQVNCQSSQIFIAGSTKKQKGK